MSKRMVPAFPESLVTGETCRAMEIVIMALFGLREENRRRVIYAAAAFYGVLPVEVEAPPVPRPPTAASKKKALPAPSPEESPGKKG